MLLRANLVVSAAVLVSSSLACSAAAPPNEGDDAPSRDIGQAASPIINGTPSSASQNSVVLIALGDSQSTTDAGVPVKGLCTGTLIAPNLVLTARHCVASTSNASIACDALGQPQPGSGSAVGTTYPASAFYVFKGQDQSKNLFDTTTKTPAISDARVLKVLDDGAPDLCNHDIALLVLNKNLSDMPISPVRLNTNVTVGEVVTSVGWGLTEKNSLTPVRLQRTGVKVLAVGPYAGLLGPNEFAVGESICEGDSGGPAFASTGAIVGIVSRGGNDTTPDPNNQAAGCVGAKTVNIYTELSPFKTFLLNGYSAAGAQPLLEGDAKGSSTMGTTTNSSSTSGCSASGTGHTGSDFFGAAFAVTALAVLGRRRSVGDRSKSVADRRVLA